MEFMRITAMFFSWGGRSKGPTTSSDQVAKLGAMIGENKKNC